MKLVLKLGGEEIASQKIYSLTRDIGNVKTEGHQILITHGGKPQLDDLLSRLKLEIMKIDGIRVTNFPVLEALKMSVAGKANADLCAALTMAMVSPVGLHGASDHLILCKKQGRKPNINGELINYGEVGEIIQFNLGLLNTLIENGYTPVISCIGTDMCGNFYNINADRVANRLYTDTRADMLIVVTSETGVLRDPKNPASVIPKMTCEETREAIKKGIVTGGMVPKLEELMTAVNQHYGIVQIVGKLKYGDLVRAVRKPGSIGTILVP